MPRVSVIIPSHNRHLLLEESLASVRVQTHEDWEVIVVDDGSDPALGLSDLGDAPAGRVSLLRNDRPRGQATCREIAERGATGDFILQLDDDDMLAPDAIESALRVFAAQPELDVVFLNVMGFGSGAAGFDERQSAALDKVIGAAGATFLGADLVRFGQGLFPALLTSVPMAFQRPVARRSAWRSVTESRRRAYGDEHHLAPPLRESEWSLYAAATQNVALLKPARYLQRCDAQGYFSIDGKRAAAQDANLDILKHLLALSATDPPFSAWRRHIRDALAACYFHISYDHLRQGSRGSALKSLAMSARMRPRWKCLRLGLRILMPLRT